MEDNEVLCGDCTNDIGEWCEWADVMNGEIQEVTPCSRCGNKGDK